MRGQGRPSPYSEHRRGTSMRRCGGHISVAAPGAGNGGAGALSPYPEHRRRAPRYGARQAGKTPTSNSDAACPGRLGRRGKERRPRPSATAAPVRAGASPRCALPASLPAVRFFFSQLICGRNEVRGRRSARRGGARTRRRKGATAAAFGVDVTSVSLCKVDKLYRACTTHISRAAAVCGPVSLSRGLRSLSVSCGQRARVSIPLVQVALLSQCLPRARLARAWRRRVSEL